MALLVLNENDEVIDVFHHDTQGNFAAIRRVPMPIHSVILSLYFTLTLLKLNAGECHANYPQYTEFSRYRDIW